MGRNSGLFKTSVMSYNATRLLVGLQTHRGNLVYLYILTIFGAVITRLPVIGSWHTFIISRLWFIGTTYRVGITGYLAIHGPRYP